MQQEDEYKENLHSGAGRYVFENARNLRQAETPAEKKLWQLLRNRQLKGKNSGVSMLLTSMYWIFIVMNVSWRLNWMAVFMTI